MERTFDLPLGTRFVYDTETQMLNLSSLCGMSCGYHAGENDCSRSGLALLGIDTRRLEGRKLHYGIDSASDGKLCFNASDGDRTIRWEGIWAFEPEFGIVSCRARLANVSDRPVTVRRALPRWVFSPGDYEVFWQMSRWCQENRLQSQRLRGSDILLHGRPARSSVGSTPFCVLCDTENRSGVAFHVLPRGNWSIRIRSDIQNSESPVAVVEAGLADTDLFLSLRPGETLELPEVLVQEVPEGDVSNLGAPLHRYMIRKRLPEAKLREAPVVYNSWLYRFTKFTREQLRRQLRAAKEIGCEVFVVDAGWFGEGGSWFGQVGNWREQKNGPFHGDMAAFADEVRAAGLGFGFWMEPERWAENIPVRKEHPEWFPEHTSRIDLTQAPAAEHFHDVIADNVRKFGAAYLKIDFNADAGYDGSGAELYHYCAALKEQLGRLREEFPELVIENCGAGGLRNDLSTATIYDHAFLSDNTHPYEALRIRQGAIMRFPPGRLQSWSVMRPQPERRTQVSQEDLVLCAAGTWDEAALFNLNFVMISGLLGIPGFSGDLADLEPELRKKIAAYVRYYKDNRKFFLNSHVFQLSAPGTGPDADDREKFMVFQMQADDCDDSLVFAFSNGFSCRTVRQFRLRELDPKVDYRVRPLFETHAKETVRKGADLMKYGLETVFMENEHIRHQAGLYAISRI